MSLIKKYLTILFSLVLSISKAQQLSIDSTSFKTDSTTQTTDTSKNRPSFRIVVTDDVGLPLDSLALAEADSVPLLDVEEELKDQLLTLDSIVTIAAIYSPMLKVQDAVINAGEEQVKISRREWIKNIYGSNTYIISNQNNLAYSAVLNDESSVFFNGYRISGNVNVPLWDIFGRQPRINLSKAELTARRWKKDELILQLKQEVTLQYYQLMNAFNILRILSDALEMSNTNTKLAEREFKESAISISEYSRVVEINVKAKTDFEFAKSNFFTYYNQFENLVGVKMSQLMQKTKK